MTQPMTTIETANQAFKKVDITSRLQPTEVSVFASVNGHAQAQIVRPRMENAVTTNSSHQ